MNASTILGLFQSFIPGFRLIDGGDLAALAAQSFSSKAGLIALAGGGQAGATPLPAALNSVDTVASDSDSVMLPLALPGAVISVYNNSAHTLAVFGQPANPNNTASAGDTIAAHNSNAQQPTATGVTQATTLVATYVCYATGKWKQFLSG